MRLLKLSFSYQRDKSLNNWEVEPLTFAPLNLIVGRNSVGKSRVLKVIYNGARMISQRVGSLLWGKWDFEFQTESGEKFHYHLNTLNEDGVLELIEVDGKVLLERNGKTRIFSALEKSMIEITPPEDKLVVQARRDVEDHPFIEQLVSWSESVFGFTFSNFHPRVQPGETLDDKLTSFENTAKLFSGLKEEAVGEAIELMNNLGFPITKVEGHPVYEDVIYVSEKGLAKAIPHNYLSQGMYRALSLAIFVQHLFQNQKPATVIIDDLGEGLDYSRAKKLGRILFEEMKERNVQLIASSNDNFLMDVVDIDYWNVLVRDGSKVRGFNAQNARKKFEEFRYTGLSNFDLLASNFLEQG